VSGNVRAGLAGGVAALYPAFAAREFYDQMPGGSTPTGSTRASSGWGHGGCSAGDPRGPVAVLLAGAVPACR